MSVLKCTPNQVQSGNGNRNIRQYFSPGSEVTFLRILRDEFGKDVFETEYYTTCNGIGYHSDIVSMEIAMTVVARQFALMTEAGYENYAKKINRQLSEEQNIESALFKLSNEIKARRLIIDARVNELRERQKLLLENNEA